MNVLKGKPSILSRESSVATRWLAGVACIAFVVWVGITLRLPLQASTVYLSPDETAVAVVADRFAHGESPAIEVTQAQTFPWLHPRSWVSRAGSIVPVGFLGAPALLTPFAYGGSRGLQLGAWLLIVSSFYPLFVLLKKRFGGLPAFAGVGIYAFSPMVLYYAARPLFPNALFVSVLLWSLFALERRAFVWAGFLAALSFAIRPIEWMWAWTWWLVIGKDIQWKRVVLGALPVAALMGGIHTITYGAPWRIGYWLRDNPNPAAVVPATQAARSTWLRVLPFGFHPRVMVANILAYGGRFLWPLMVWMAGAVAFWVVYLRRHASAIRSSETVRFVVSIVSTFGALLLVYGGAVYADHVRVGAVTIGNSFLRYLLPLSVFASAATAYLASHCTKRLAQVALTLAVLGCMVFGGWSVLAADDESLVHGYQERARYQEIREAMIPSECKLIVSERSDKIAFPEKMSVSPMPAMSELKRFIESSGCVLVFSRPFSQATRDAWYAAGVRTTEGASFGRERLYELYLR